MMTDSDYIKTREMFRLNGERAVQDGNDSRADYYSGIVRGLDLAFQDGTAKKS